MRLRKIILASVLVFTATSVSAADKYSYEKASAGHTGYYEMTTKPENYRVLWQRALGAKEANAIFSRMGSIVDGAAYFSFDEIIESEPKGSRTTQLLVAVDTQTGRDLWRVVYKGQVLLGRPVASGNKVFMNYNNYGSHYHNLNAYDAKTGKVAYSLPDHGDPIPFQSSVYLHDYSSGKYTSLDFNNGDRQWLSNGDIQIRKIAIDNEYIAAKHDDGIHVMDRNTGKNLFVVNTPGLQEPYYARELVLDQKTNTVYTPYSPKENRWNASLYAVDLIQKAVRWVVPGQNINSQPVVVGDYVYNVSHEGVRLNAINAITGKIEWQWQPPEDDAQIYDASNLVATSDVIFVEGGKRIYAVSLKTHQTVWTIEQTGHMALGDNKLFILSLRDGTHQDYDYVTAVALS